MLNVITHDTKRTYITQPANNEQRGLNLSASDQQKHPRLLLHVRHALGGLHYCCMDADKCRALSVRSVHTLDPKASM